MLSRMFGRRRQSSAKEDEDTDYVIVEGGRSQSIPEVASMYSLEGATAFQDSANPRSANSAARSTSHEDPLDGVPFKLTVSVSGEGGGTDLTEAMAVMAKMEATDWDSYQYHFKVEKSILEECNDTLPMS